MGNFVEFEILKALIAKKPDIARFELLEEVEFKGEKYPIYGLVMGPEDPKVPTFGLFAGVHGLERVGSQLVLSYIESLFEQLAWDKDLQRKFEDSRFVSIPIINPVGIAMGTRSNGNGVDLMRNSPVDAGSTAAFLVGGHRMGKWLPWYRGEVEAEMQKESKALCDFVARHMFPSQFSMSVDVHSGFGIRDRLWYPYARSKEIFPCLREVEKFKSLVDHTRPHHVYMIEAQSLNYTTHGDLWDYIFDLHCEDSKLKGDTRFFVPWTLEMGSWLWVRKNPIQLFSSLGAFNPIKEHRFRRVMRRHKPLLELFFSAVRNHEEWLKKY
ncbi:zinc carboxypeptidase [bacterium]|nr:zinc carboxypeptidase [bacterium]